jgi:hypothetical protein
VIYKDEADDDDDDDDGKGFVASAMYRVSSCNMLSCYLTDDVEPFRLPEHSEGYVIDQWRWSHLVNLTRNLRSNGNRRLLYARFRSRNATRWNQQSRSQAAAARNDDDVTGLHPYDDPHPDALVTEIEPDKYRAAVAKINMMVNIRKRKDNYHIKESRYIRHSLAVLDSAFGKVVVRDTANPPRGAPHLSFTTSHAYINGTDTTAMTTRLMRKPEDEDDDEAPPRRRGRRDPVDSDDGPELNECQRKAMTLCQLVVEFVTRYPEMRELAQVLVLIHGGPGTGKTFFSRSLSKAVRKKLLRVIGTAFAGAAAGNMLRGSTVHKLFHLGRPKGKKKKGQKGVPQKMDVALQPLSGPELKEAKEAFKNAVFLLLDEVSMVNPIMLAHINTRLQQIMDKPSVPFGGLSIIAFGDFFQLPPTSGQSLHTSMVDKLVSPDADPDITLPSTQGTMLFSQFRLLEFTVSERNRGDPQHAKLVSRLRSVDDMYPFTHGVINQFRFLSPQDFQEDPSWSDASIVVTCNAERMAINEQQAIRFAYNNGVPVIRWRAKLTGDYKSASPTVTQSLFDNYSELWNTFVQGAGVVITDNINPSKGIGNGVDGHLHSLSFDPSLGSEKIRSIMNLVERAQPGQVLYLDDPPLSVNIELYRDEEEKPSWPSDETLVKDKIVIPIMLNKFDDDVVVELEDEGEDTVHFVRHAFDLTFAVTYHKVRTAFPSSPMLCFWQDQFI